MAIAAGAIFEVRSSASDGNGGFFVPGTSGTIDYSQQNAPQLSVTDGVANGTTTITSTTGGFTSAMVNNGVNIAGALYQITAVGSSTSITVDRTVATASALAVNVGGALASPGITLTVINGGSTVYVQSGTYNFSTTSSVSGGQLDPSLSPNTPNFSRTAPVSYIGYTTTRGDGGPAKPIFAATANNQTLVAAYSYCSYFNFELNAGTFTGVTGIDVGYSAFTYENLSCINCEYGFWSASNFTNANMMVVRCFASGCTNAFTGVYFEQCVALNCTNGFSNSGTAAGFFNRCIAIGCTTGFAKSWCINCTAFNCPTAFSLYDTGQSVNCIAYGSTAYGVGGNYPSLQIFNFAFGANAANFNSAGVGSSSNQVNLTANPFVDSAATIVDTPSAFAAFALNNTAGGGALCRGAGTPQYLDIGAVQHQDSGGGGVPRIVVPRRMW